MHDIKSGAAANFPHPRGPQLTTPSPVSVWSHPSIATAYSSTPRLFREGWSAHPAPVQPPSVCLGNQGAGQQTCLRHSRLRVPSPSPANATTHLHRTLFTRVWLPDVALYKLSACTPTTPTCPTCSTACHPPYSPLVATSSLTSQQLQPVASSSCTGAGW